MKILSPDHPAGRFFCRIFDLAVLNLLFLLACIPVFTVGAAVTALYDVMLRLVKDEEGALVKGFFSAFAENFKKATLCFLPMLAAALVLIWNLYWYVNGYVSVHAGGMKLALLAGLILLCMVGEWMFVWQARFVNTIKEIWHNALIFTFRYFLQNLIFMAATLLWVYVTVFFPQFWIAGIFFAFSLPAFLKSLFYRNKMQPFEDLIRGQQCMDEKSSMKTSAIHLP